MGMNKVLYNIDQRNDTTDAEKATARANIGAQGALTAGQNITISEGVISAANTEYQAGHGLTLSNNTFAVDDTDLQAKLAAGANIQINGNTISATDTTYTAGTNVQISSDNVISATDTTYTAGTNVQINSSNVISATDTKYTAGTNVQISAGNVISATDTKYTAGSGLALNGTEFSNSAPNVKSDWNAAAGSSAEILNKPSVPSIKTVTTALPPVETAVSTMALITDGRVTVNNSTDVGLLAPIGTQADAGKVLTGTYSGSPGKFTASWAPVQSPLSAGYGISIANNVVSAKPKAGGGLDVGSDGLYVTAHHVSYDANQGLNTTNQRNARKNINALTWNQFTGFSNTLTLERTGRTFLDNNVVWAGNSPRHTWKGLWSIVVPAHCYMLWSIGGQLRLQENAQTEWAISLNEDSDTYPTSELYSTYFMSNGSGILSTNLPGIWHFYSSGLNQHTVYIGMYNSSADVPSTGAALYGKIYAPAGDGQRKIGPWLTYFIMEAANIKADE